MSKYDDLNSCLLEGRLVKDPILKTFENNKKVCKFSIATNHSYKAKDGTYRQEASFFDIQVWNNSGSLCMQYLTKGSIVRLRGCLKQDKWEDREGKKCSKIIINADHIEFRQIKAKATEKSEKPYSALLSEESDMESTVDLNEISVF